MRPSWRTSSTTVSAGSPLNLLEWNAPIEFSRKATCRPSSCTMQLTFHYSPKLSQTIAATSSRLRVIRYSTACTRNPTPMMMSFSIHARLWERSTHSWSIWRLLKNLSKMRKYSGMWLSSFSKRKMTWERRTGNCWPRKPNNLWLWH